jgi:alginate O-acetyltransferase complex protein AlgI
MLFASPTFLFVFLPACLAAYFACRGMAVKNAVLLGASWLFYAWGEPVYVLLLLAMSGFNYAAALAIDAQAEEARRRRVLAGAVAVNLAVLGVFKYAAFAVSSLDWALRPAGLSIPAPHLTLPLGISFFTFHALSYLIDVERRRFPANRNAAEVALYIAFFPQLIAGPIVRYRTIARRLRKRRHSLGRVSAGLRIFVIGLAQKLIIADAVAPLADAVFDHARHPAMGESWLGAGAYALQIYFDFAGYSNMAIGLGVAFGFSLPRNFRRPYASASITEFWRRWHISLSSWFRDYLYIPLGGNRGPGWKTWRNLIVVFLLCGLWHGAAWTFVLWGAWHGVFLSLERAGLGRWLARAPRPAAWAYALMVVTLGWVLFRSADLGRTLDIWAGMAGAHGLGGFTPATAMALTREQAWLMPLAAVLAVARLPRWRLNAGPFAGWADNLAVAGLAGLSLLQVAAGTFSPFLYFRF